MRCNNLVASAFMLLFDVNINAKLTLTYLDKNSNLEKPGAINVSYKAEIADIHANFIGP